LIGKAKVSGCWVVLNGALRTLNVSNASFRASGACPGKDLVSVAAG